MQRSLRAGWTLARTLLSCLMVLSAASQVHATDLLGWREAGSLDGLVEHLEDWLDRHSELPRRETVPVVKWTSVAGVTALTGSQRAAHVATVRGLYDAEGATIWLVRPWSARDPRDVSVLLHELVHHRQAASGHWYCPGAQELPAYRLQQAWLGELGLPLEVNWVAIVLESGCTARDFHPD